MTPGRQGSGRCILRPFPAVAQCPYIAVLVTAHSAVELQRGEPAEHFGDRKLEFAGDVGGAQSENV